MPTIVAANESSVLIDGKAVEGVRSIEYRFAQTRDNVYAVGDAERIGVTSGGQYVEGRLRVASTVPAIAQLPADKPFQISAQLKHGDTKVTLSFDDCFLTEKTFAMTASSFGESAYTFTATRVREEIG
jgi:hypothetical protein